jgi:hypothetical protein
MRFNVSLSIAASAFLLAIPAASRAEQHTLKPGQYAMTTEMKMEGVDRAIPPTTVDHCFTEADVNDQKKLAEGGQGRNKDCETSDMKTTASGMSWAMTCKSGAKGTGEIVYRADGYEMNMNMETPGGPHGNMKMKIHTTAKRTGDCK